MLFDKTIFFSRMYHLYPVIIFNFFNHIVFTSYYLKMFHVK